MAKVNYLKHNLDSRKTQRGCTINLNKIGDLYSVTSSHEKRSGYVVRYWGKSYEIALKHFQK